MFNKIHSLYQCPRVSNVTTVPGPEVRAAASQMLLSRDCTGPRWVHNAATRYKPKTQMKTPLFYSRPAHLILYDILFSKSMWIIYYLFSGLNSSGIMILIPFYLVFFLPLIFPLLVVQQHHGLEHIELLHSEPGGAFVYKPSIDESH